MPTVARRRAPGESAGQDPSRTKLSPEKGTKSLTTTQVYLHADMHQKQEAIGKTAPPGSKQKRYQPPDPLLEFLENL